MANLHPSSNEVVRFLVDNGFKHVHTRGSHMIFRSADGRQRVSVPRRKEMGVGLFRAILSEAGFTVDDFTEWNTN